jgi:hypothetical protein
MFQLLDKNPGWVQIMDGMRTIMMIIVMSIRPVVNQSTSPCDGASARDLVRCYPLLC